MLSDIREEPFLVFRELQGLRAGNFSFRAVLRGLRIRLRGLRIRLRGLCAGFSGLRACAVFLLFGGSLLRFPVRRLIEIGVAPAPPDHHDRGFREIHKALLDLSGKGVSAPSVHELPKLVIDPDLLFFQRCLERFRAFDSRGTAQHGLDCRFAENTDRRAFPQRQHAVLIFKEDNAFPRDVPAHFGAGFPQFPCVLVLRRIILRSFRSFLFIVLLSQHQPDRLLSHGSGAAPPDRAGKNGKSQQHSCNCLPAKPFYPALKSGNARGCITGVPRRRALCARYHIRFSSVPSILTHIVKSPLWLLFMLLRYMLIRHPGSFPLYVPSPAAGLLTTYVSIVIRNRLFFFKNITLSS